MMQNGMERLPGQVAWITGAGSGIGQAAATALAQEGVQVVLTGRRADALHATAARIGPTATVHAGDVTDSARMAAIASEIHVTLGRLDIVVNNAGMNVTRRAWAELTPGAIDQVLATNLNSAFYCVAAALPLMRAGGGGLFIHIGSRAGRFWDGQSGAGYTTAKAALAAMSHSINREEFGNAIRSTILHPGETATPILQSRGVDMPHAELARLLKPEDVGDLVRYIACLPPHVCMNEVLLTPTWNRTFATTRALPNRP